MISDMIFDLTSGVRNPTGIHDPKYCQIIGFRPSAREDDLRRTATQQGRDRLARPFHRRPRLLPVVVNGRGIAKMLAEIRPHGFQHLGQHGGGRVIVEIDALHHLLLLLY